MSKKKAKKPAAKKATAKKKTAKKATKKKRAAKKKTAKKATKKKITKKKATKKKTAKKTTKKKATVKRPTGKTKLRLVKDNATSFSESADIKKKKSATLFRSEDPRNKRTSADAFDDSESLGDLARKEEAKGKAPASNDDDDDGWEPEAEELRGNFSFDDKFDEDEDEV